MDISMLKECLGEELYAQAEEKLSGLEGMQVIATHDGTWVPKGRLDEEIAKRREAQAAMEAAQKQIAENEGLQSQVEHLTEELRQRDERLAALRRGEETREALRRAGARDAEVAERMIDPEGDMDEQIGALRERYPYLFEEEPGSVRAGFGSRTAGRGRMGGHADVNGAIRAAAGRSQY